MSKEIAEHLGQLIMTGIRGVHLEEKERNFIQSCGIGGVLLFSRNFKTPELLRELIHSIQKLKRNYPLLIAVDQEGGRVIRFKKYFCQFPSMRDMAKTNSPSLCFQSFEIMARELASCGINLNLAPVCDLVSQNINSVIGDRSFGPLENQVSKFVVSALEGMKSVGILGCAKHFPGHGSVVEDSHDILPTLNKNLESIKIEDCVPFRAAVNAGVDFVMMGHLLSPALDPHFPTSLSQNAYKFLREELKFNGPIITDDMQMGAITKHFKPQTAALKAIHAGADMIEYRDIDQASQAHFCLKEALESGNLSKDTLKEKIERILHLKKQLSLKCPSFSLKNTSVGTKQHQDFLTNLRKKIALKSPL